MFKYLLLLTVKLVLSHEYGEDEYSAALNFLIETMPFTGRHNTYILIEII